ncbi:DUF357 domain-containing protein [Candidatus Woesearchaeota archaeon]|nr:DUF357 domain-containing protein [Candidatus Woesearchaeota archaeon]
MLKDKITSDRLEKEFDITKKALEKVKIIVSEDSGLYEKAVENLEMAKRYCSDAKHFKQKKDFASAFGALNYAFGLIDAGIKLGVFSEHGLY